MSRYLLFVIFLQLLVSCAPISQVKQKSDLLAYFPQEYDQSRLSRFHPIFIVEKQHESYNRIGTPRAKLMNDGKELVYVDPGEATVYAEERLFETPTGTYTNLIYRIHFSETPFSLMPFQLGQGKNVGLIVIVTLNKFDEPILYTTVHTCGCYLAFIPTTYLAPEFYPPRWPVLSQIVYSEILPASLDPKLRGVHNSLLAVMIRNASHRVMELWLTDTHSLQKYKAASIKMQPLSSLENLPLAGTDQTTSFYETEGRRTGYVKHSQKTFEKLLMSWWAFDPLVGEDKKLGKTRTDPPIFYTSLKIWARDKSDMRDFPTFLNYWGWKF